MDNSIRIAGEKTRNSENLNLHNIVSYTRSMALYHEDIISEWNRIYEIYYMYFIDGDNWGKQERWINRDMNDDFIDKEATYELSNLITYKDSMFMFADEFLIISEKDLDEELEELNTRLKYTVSALKFTNRTLNLTSNDLLEFRSKLKPFYNSLKEMKSLNGKSKIYKGE